MRLMEEPHSRNSADRLVWWLLGTCAALLMAGLVAWVRHNDEILNNLSTQINLLEGQQQVLQRRIEVIDERQRDVRERLTAMEREARSMAQRLYWIDYQMPKRSVQDPSAGP